MRKPISSGSIAIFTWAMMSLPVIAALDVNPPMPITRRVAVQPIILSDSDGGNTAEMFGNASQNASIESLIDTIWAQAGIDVQWLAPNFWNNTTANSGGYSLGNLGGQGNSAGVSNVDPLVLNVYFSEITVGSADNGENSANGLAWVGANGISQAVGDNLVGWLGGQEVIAGVVAHEIGHNLGLDHTSGSNLMTNGSTSERLTSSQIDIARNSSFSVLVPTDPADFNGDGFVNREDLLVWEDKFGTSPNATQPDGDADADGDVDGNDFLLWQRAIDISNTVSVSTTVPEPSTLAMGVLAAMGLLWNRRH